MVTPKLVKKCKLCQLIKTDKVLWQSVHTKVIDDGLAYSIVCDWLNMQIDAMGYDLPPFNEANFSTHFKKHITDDDAKKKTLRQMMLDEAEKGSRAYSNEEQEEAEAFFTLEEPEHDPEDVENYKFLQRYVKTAQKHIEKYGKMLEESSTQKPQSYFYEIEGFHTLLASLAKVQDLLSKLKSSEKVAGRAVYVAVEMVSVAIIDSVVEAVTEAETLLAQEMPGSRLPSEIKKMILNKTKSRAKEAGNDTLKRVYGSFRIK